MPATFTPVIQDFPYREDAEVLFAAIRDLPDPVWLDSGKPHSLQGRFDIISAAPITGLESGHSTLPPAQRYPILEPGSDPFRAGKALIHEFGAVNSGSTHLPFNGGLIGYFSYSLGESLALDVGGGRRTHATPQRRIALPDLRLGFYAWALVLNHQTRKAWFVRHPACAEGLSKDVLMRLTDAQNSARMRQTSNKDPYCDADFSLLEPFKASSTRTEYGHKLRAIRNYIEAGDCYQVNFAQLIKRNAFDSTLYKRAV